MKHALLSAAALVAVPGLASAQAGEAPPAAEVDAVVVTAARSPQPLAETPASITVVSRETLTQRQTVIVSDELARTPGVAVNRNGGPGGVTSVRIRGAEADQTVVLVDGVKLNDPASVGGGFDFSTVLSWDVERIEVLRGPQSTLYGSQAIGGVVNLITAAPKGPAARLSAEAGARGTAYLRGSADVGGARARLRLGAGSFQTDGVSAFRGGAEADGFRQTHLTARADARLSDVAALDLRAYRAESRTDFDGFAPPTFAFGDTAEFGELVETVAYAGLTYAALGGRFGNRLGYAFTDTERDNFDPGGFAPRSFESEGRNGRLEYQGVLALPRHARLTFGAETEKSRLRTRSPFSGALEREVGLDSVYAQGSAPLAPGASLTLGLRRDEHETFGGATTGQAGLVYARGVTTVRANYGGGFKAPSLFQIYSEFGNIQLQPERADGVDLGVEQRFGPRLSGSATMFARNTSDQIDFVFCVVETAPGCAGRLFGGYYANLDRTEARGLELAATARPTGALTLGLAYTYTRAENVGKGDPNRGRRLPRRPEHTGYIDADYRFAGGATAGAGVQHVGERFDDAANAFRLDGYTLVDARVAYPVRKGVELFGRVENLFDAEYEDVRLYGTPGRGGFVGVRATF